MTQQFALLGNLSQRNEYLCSHKNCTQMFNSSSTCNSQKLENPDVLQQVNGYQSYSHIMGIVPSNSKKPNY